MDADQILVLSHGRIVERGTHSQLLEAKGEYARMWALQQEQAQAQEVLEKATPVARRPNGEWATPRPDSERIHVDSRNLSYSLFYLRIFFAVG